MDFQSAMETFAEAWVAANTQTALTEAAEAQVATLTSAQQQQPKSSTAPQSADGGTTAEGIDPSVEGNCSDPDRTMRHRYRNRYAHGHQGAHHRQCHQGTAQGPGKSIPVHCVVRSVVGCAEDNAVVHRGRIYSSDSDSDSDDKVRSRSRVELDSYVIIPSGTLLSELVRTALVKLGYTAPEARGARGSIQIRNWKSLPLDAISDDAEARVGDILGELTAVATLRIRLRSRPNISSASDVKEKLLQLLLTQSQSLLTSAGCPIDENQLALISKGTSAADLPEDTRRRFDQWYLQQVVDHRAANRPRLLAPAPSQDPEPPSAPCAVDGGHRGAGDVEPNCSSAHKTRMRTSFDPELELPQLHQWFSKNQHPTRLQIQNYVRQLNNLESRRGRRMLTEQNVLYWFKNARAACKRAELRHVNGSSPGNQDNDSAGSNDSSRIGPRHGPVTSTGAMDLSMTHHQPHQNPMAGDLSAERQQPAPVSNGHWSHEVKREPSTATEESHQQLQQQQEEEEDDDDDEDEDCKCECDCEHATSPALSPPAALKQSPPSSGNPDLARSVLYMANYLPAAAAAAAAAMSALDERRKRNRTFIDPVTEVPRLEQWFSCNTHPSHNLILKYTEELNRMPYRQKFPKLEPKNVQFWFKNRRAKSKRLRVCPS